MRRGPSRTAPLALARAAIPSGSAVQPVDSRPAGQSVGAWASVQDVAALLAEQDVSSADARDDVDATAALEVVRVTVTDEPVAEARARQALDSRDRVRAPEATPLPRSTFTGAGA